MSTAGFLFYSDFLFYFQTVLQGGGDIMSDFGLSSAGTTVAFASCMDERHPPENIVDGYMSLETLQSQSVRGLLVRP